LNRLAEAVLDALAAQAINVDMVDTGIPVLVAARFVI
jgi:hypothetical protein